MGRDKPKKYDKMDFHQKRAWQEEQLEKYNLDSAEKTVNGRFEMYDEAANLKRIENAQRNDFDYRTSAQHMDGVKGDASASDFIDYQRGAVKLHKQAGNEGSFSSTKDITGVTNNLVRDANKFMMGKIDALSANEQQSQAETGVAEPASTELQDARDTVDELGNKDYDIFRSNIDNGDNQNQRDQATNAFFQKYKLDLAEEKNISPVLPS